MEDLSLHIKGSSRYIQQYHPMNVDKDKLRLEFKGMRKNQLDIFMHKMGFSTFRDLFHYVAFFHREFNLPVVILHFDKVDHITANPQRFVIKCLMDNPLDVEAWYIVNHIFETTEAHTTRQNVWYSMFVQVRKYLRNLKKQELYVFHETLKSTKRRYDKFAIHNLRVGEYIEYKGSRFEAELRLDQWYNDNAERGNQYVIVEEDNKLKIYREI